MSTESTDSVHHEVNKNKHVLFKFLFLHHIKKIVYRLFITELLSLLSLLFVAY